VEHQPLSSLSVHSFLTRLGSDTPTPGGGSAAALAGALAAGLGRMVAAYTLGKPKFAAVADEVGALAQRLARSQEMLERLIDEDASAYAALREGFRLDKSDPRRGECIADLAVLAGSVPLETATICAAVLTDARRLAEIGNPMLAADSQASQALARAGVDAAAANVRANLGLMPPAGRERIAGALEHVLAAVSSE